MKQMLLAVATFSVSGMLAGSLTTLRRPLDSRIELTDSKGKVRARLGMLEDNDSKVGIQFFDSSGNERATLSVKDSETVVDLSGGSIGEQYTIKLSDAGAVASIGKREGWRLFVGTSATDQLKVAHANGVSPTADCQLDIDSIPGKEGHARLSLSHDKSGAVALSAEEKGALAEIFVDGASAGKFAAVKNMGTFLLLGKRKMGAFLQALSDGNSMLEFSKEKPLLTLQQTKLGAGLALSRDDGTEAIRLGLNAQGEVVDKHFDASGKLLPQSSSGK